MRPGPDQDALRAAQPGEDAEQVVGVPVAPTADEEGRGLDPLLVAAQQVFIFLKSVLKVGYYAAVRDAVMRRPAAEPVPVEGPAESVRITG